MLSGRIEAEHLPELRRLIEGEDGQRTVTFDLREVELLDRDAVNFADCEAAGATLENCPAYVREWIPEGARKPRTRGARLPRAGTQSADDLYARGDRDVITTGSTTEHRRQ